MTWAITVDHLFTSGMLRPDWLDGTQSEGSHVTLYYQSRIREPCYRTKATHGQMIRIGELIKEQLHEQGKTVVWLAQQLSCSRNNIYKIFHSYSIATQQLLRISKILNYDFFAIYTEELSQWKKATQCEEHECN